MKKERLTLIAAMALLIAVLAAFGFNGAGFDIKEVFAETAAKTEHKGSAGTKAADEKTLLSAILKRQQELDAREDELKVREERLQALKNDVDSRVKELGKIHSKIEADVKKIDEVKGERVKRVVKIYESMSPDEAATRLEKLDEEFAVMILASMSEKKAAKILGFVNIGKSVRLSKSIVKNH